VPELSSIFEDDGKTRQLTTGLITENSTHLETMIKDPLLIKTIREHQTLIHQVLLNSV
jgi:hypothetical protein